MGYEEDKEVAELERLYPPGSPERKVLEYSQGSKKGGEVPPLLLTAFKILMGISITVAVVTVAAALSQMR